MTTPLLRTLRRLLAVGLLAAAAGCGGGPPAPLEKAPSDRAPNAKSRLPK